MLDLGPNMPPVILFWVLLEFSSNWTGSLLCLFSPNFMQTSENRNKLSWENDATKRQSKKETEYRMGEK